MKSRRAVPLYISHRFNGTPWSWDVEVIENGRLRFVTRITRPHAASLTSVLKRRIA